MWVMGSLAMLGARVRDRLLLGRASPHLLWTRAVPLPLC